MDIQHRSMRRRFQEIFTPMMRVIFTTVGYAAIVVFAVQSIEYLDLIYRGIPTTQYASFLPLAGFLTSFVFTLTWQSLLDGEQPRPHYVNSLIVDQG